MSEQTPQKTTLTINWLQIAGGAGAAVTSAVLLAGLKAFGTYGTLVGAALGSIIASTAAAVYGHYLNASKERVAEVARRARDRRTGTVPPVPAPQDEHPEPADPPVVDEGAPPPGPPEPPRRKRFRPIHALIVGLAAFVLAIGAIFVWEQVSGESVTGQRQGSTAQVNKGVFGNEVTSSATTTPSETATPTDTATSTETGTSTETSTATDSATAESTDTATSTETSTSTSTRTSTSTGTATSTAQQSQDGSQDESEDGAASTPTSSADSSDAALAEPTGTATTAP